MPKPPRFPTHRAQQTAVAIVTFAVLAVALAAAQVYTLSQNRDYSVAMGTGKVDELVLPLPEGWTRRDTIGRDMRFGGKPQVFVDPVNPGRILTVARRELPMVLPPHAVLGPLAMGLLPPRGMYYEQHDHAIKTKRGVGHYFRGVRPTEERGLIVADWMAVYTEDGRRHWMIHVSMPLKNTAAAMRTNEEMVLAMVEGADDTAIIQSNADAPGSPSPAEGPDNPAKSTPEPAKAP